MWKHLISVTGNTAAGTTTLTRRLSQLVGWQPVYSEESLNRSPFFTKFLQMPARWAFHNQAFFIADYADVYRSVTNEPRPKEQALCLDFTVFELTVYTDAMKERGFLTPDEYQILTRTIELLRPSWHLPDLLIYLTADLDELMNRILQRGRIAEWLMDRDYVRTLQVCFDRFIESWSMSPSLIVNSSSSNFDNDEVVRKIADQALITIAITS